jgi:hypothetical protein
MKLDFMAVGPAHINCKELPIKYKHKLHILWFRNTFVEIYCSKCMAAFNPQERVLPCLNDALWKLKLSRILRKYMYYSVERLETQIKKLTVSTIIKTENRGIK